MYHFPTKGSSRSTIPRKHLHKHKAQVYPPACPHRLPSKYRISLNPTYQHQRQGQIAVPHSGCQDGGDIQVPGNLRCQRKYAVLGVFPQMVCIFFLNGHIVSTTIPQSVTPCRSQYVRLISNSFIDNGFSNSLMLIHSLTIKSPLIFVQTKSVMYSLQSSSRITLHLTSEMSLFLTRMLA